MKVVTSGAGAAAIAITKLLLSAGFQTSRCATARARSTRAARASTGSKTEMAEVTNLSRKAGSLADMLVGADVFIGVSAPELSRPRWSGR